MAQKQYRPGQQSEEQVAEFQEFIAKETGIHPSANEAAAELIRKGYLHWRVSLHGKKVSR